MSNFDLAYEIQILTNINYLDEYSTEQQANLSELMETLALTAADITTIGTDGVNALLQVKCLEPIINMLEETEITLAAIVEGLKNGVSWKQISMFMTHMMNAKSQNATEPMQLIEKVWPVIVTAPDKKRDYLLDKMPDILIIVIVNKLSLEQINDFTLPELISYLEDGLNKTQQQTIDSVILYYIDDMIENCIDDFDRLKLGFSSCIAPALEQLEDTNIADDIEFINKLYNHPCPENPSVNIAGTVPTHTDLVTYCEQIDGQKIYRQKPKGLLNLEQHDVTDRPVHREAVRHYIRQVIHRYINQLNEFSDDYRQFIQKHATAIKYLINVTNINLFDLHQIGVNGAAILLEINQRGMMKKAISIINEVHISIPQFVALEEPKRNLLIQHAASMLLLHKEAHLSWQELVNQPIAKMTLFLHNGTALKYLLVTGAYQFENLCALDLPRLKALLMPNEPRITGLFKATSSALTPATITGYDLPSQRRSC